MGGTWKEFKSTGSVEQYLRFKEIERMEKLLKKK